MTDHPQLSGTRDSQVGPRVVVVMTVLALALIGAAFGLEGLEREVAVLSLCYALAFRLILLGFIGRSRDLDVVLALPLLAGVLVAEWWAGALCVINLFFNATLGARRDIPSTKLTLRELTLFTALEACLLLVGAGLGRLVGM